MHEYQSTRVMGGAVIGTSPGNFVTNKYSQVWDTPSVFVTGTALFPRDPGGNRMSTITPVTYLAGDAVGQQYLKHPGRIIG